MFTEEFYKQDLEGKDVVDFFYISTLQLWLTHNDLSIYEELLTHFEQTENYLICDGIHKAITFIDKCVADRFENATKLVETELEQSLSFEEHKRVSNLIFKDVVTEIYEKQIGDISGSSGE